MVTALEAQMDLASSRLLLVILHVKVENVPVRIYRNLVLQVLQALVL